MKAATLPGTGPAIEQKAAAEPGLRRRPARARRRRSRWVAYAYLALPVAFYLAFMIYPLLDSLWISFYNWDGIGVATWAGLGNYTRVISDPVLRASIVHSFELMLFFVVFPIAAALGLTALMTGSGSRAHPVARTLLFIPQILPPVAVAVAWRWIYGQYGLLNQVLGWVGLSGQSRAWLGDFTWAFPALGLVGTWVCTGLCLVFFLAGAQKVPGELYEAVQLDGGGRWREFRSVTLPHLRREIGVAATVTTIAALASFDIVYVMTSGGPGTTTMVPGVLIYQLAFTAGRVGQACALSIVLSLIVFGVIAVINKLAGARE
jgi:raffinose/stachyose/melibiose transport system permease protein